MSVGYARRRGQEGRPVLFAQQGPHFIRVVRQTQVCLERALNLTEKKKGVQQQTTHTVLYSLFVYMSTLRGLFCGFHFVTLFCSLCHEVWEAIQKLQPCQGSGQCLQIKLELRSIMGSHSGVCVYACVRVHH